MSQAINILHISDFHLKRQWHSTQDAVASAFKLDAMRLSDGLVKPDIIVITGDLAKLSHGGL
jgi:3',5'-cyclic AMP phosphodiesterase CpdA